MLFKLGLEGQAGFGEAETGQYGRECKAEGRQEDTFQEAEAAGTRTEMGKPKARRGWP